MKKLSILLLLLLAVSMVTCGGESSPGGPAGKAIEGEKVYNEVAVPACNTCHSVEPGVDLVGPSLANIGAEAGSRVAGMTAAQYLAESIEEPNAYIVEGFPSNLMPDMYRTQLTEEQLKDVIAYLMTLK